MFSSSEEHAAEQFARREGSGGIRERKRRLFFAIWPDDDLRGAIEHGVRKPIRRSGGAAVPARNLHVTLVFLGGVDAAGFEAAKAAAGSVRRPAFDLVLDRLETWPRQPLLCLAPSETCGPLRDLAIALRDQLDSRGFEIERRPFRAHVTLARKVNRPKAREPIDLPAWAVREFVLVESVTGASGSEYTVVGRWPLEAGG